MSLSVEKLFNIINIVKDEARNGSSDDKIYGILREAELLPAKFVKDYIESKVVKMDIETIFASKQAEEQASKLKLVLQPGGGSAKNNRYSLADINKIAKSAKTKELNISPQALIRANDLGIPITALEDTKGSGNNGRILLSDIEALNSMNDEQEEQVNITARAKELADEAKIKVENLTGSGHKGKITVDDIKKAISESSDSDSSKKDQKKITKKKQVEVKSESEESEESEESDDEDKKTKTVPKKAIKAIKGKK